MTSINPGTLQDAYNQPSKQTDMGASTGRNQKDRRYPDTFFDMHRHSQRFPKGRPWTGQREIAANRDLILTNGSPPPDGFIGTMSPGEYVMNEAGGCDRPATFGSVWDAPWVPVEKYWRYDYRRKTISFDYAKMHLEESQSLELYYEAAAQMGAALNIRVDYGVLPQFQILSKIGRPTKMVKIAEAAMAGDPWLLGFRDETNPELADILGLNRRGMRVTSFVPTPSTPLIQPAEVVALTSTDALLKRLEALEEELKQSKVRERMANARAAKGGKKDADEASEPAEEAAPV